MNRFAAAVWNPALNEWVVLDPSGPPSCPAIMTTGYMCAAEADRQLSRVFTCQYHYDLMLNAMRPAMREEAAHRENEYLADRLEERRKEDARAQTRERRRTVYYIQRADGLIKIGVTGNLATRLRALKVGPDDLPVVLATHLGGVRAETAAHALFKGCRVAGEWFSPVPELLAHIERVKRGLYPPATSHQVPWLGDVEREFREAARVLSRDCQPLDLSVGCRILEIPAGQSAVGKIKRGTFPCKTGSSDVGYPVKVKDLFRTLRKHADVVALRALMKELGHGRAEAS